MHKSTRFEHLKNPYYERPSKDFIKYLNKVHRSAQKKIIKEGVEESETKDR